MKKWEKPYLKNLEFLETKDLYWISEHNEIARGLIEYRWDCCCGAGNGGFDTPNAAGEEADRHLASSEHNANASGCLIS